MSQGRTDPIKFDLEKVRTDVSGHGTEITALHAVPSFMFPYDARAVLSTRFLTNPDFRVSVDGIVVTFNDVPDDCLEEFDIEVPDRGTVHVMVLDSQRTDKSAKQHGIAWWVNRRLVAQCGWRLSDQPIIEGFVLGDSIRAADNRERKEGDRTFIRPLLYSSFIGQAEKRMMNLQSKLLDAPFMKAALAELYPAAGLIDVAPAQTEFAVSVK